MTADDLTLTVVTQDEATLQALSDRAIEWLDEHSRTFDVVFEKKPLAIEAHVAARSVGILCGSTNLSWLHVQLLAVAPKHRRGGVGRRLMNEAEALARERGCIGAWLDTYDHQGPDYYPRLGYTECGRIDDMPPGRVRLFFQKRF